MRELRGWIYTGGFRHYRPSCCAQNISKVIAVSKAKPPSQYKRIASAEPQRVLPPLEPRHSVRCVL